MSRERFPELVLDDQLAPITVEVGFLRQGCADVVSTFIDWQEELLGTRAHITVSHTRSIVTGELGALLANLLPLREILSNRYIFIPTATGWTAFLDNGVQGPDVGSPVTVLAHRLHCLGLRVVADPAEVAGRPRRPVSHGAMALDVYDPSVEPDLWPPARGLAAIRDYDDQTWIWREIGTPQKFERRDRPRRKQDRLTLDRLREYLESFGIRAFDDDWYAPERQAVLVTQRVTGKKAPELRYFSIEEAQELCLEPHRATQAIGF